MKKVIVLLVTLVSVLSPTAFAGKNDDCPLKTLKNTRLGADGTAYIPGRTSASNSKAISIQAVPVSK